MKIYELYTKKKPVISFEIFPPKPETPVETIFSTIEQLKELKPAFLSVTYGAGGSSATRSIEIASKVKNDYGIETMAHLTCVNSSRAQIDAILHQLASHNIENILALRGDPPSGESVFKQADGGYQYAKDLIAHIKECQRYCIAGAAYPEGHLECGELDLDIQYLKEKVDEGVDFLITQLFFDNSRFYEFLEKAQAKGIACPVAVGIMPVLNVSQIKRITSLCGASIPAKLTRVMEKYGGVAADMEKAGIEYACEQIADLLSNQVDGIHLYTMNKAGQTKSIVNSLGIL